MHSHHQPRDEHEEEGQGAPDEMNLWWQTAVQEHGHYLKQLQSCQYVCHEV